MSVLAELVPRDQAQRIGRGRHGSVVLRPQRLAAAARHLPGAAHEASIKAWCKRRDPKTSGIMYGRRHGLKSFLVATMILGIHRRPVVGVSVEITRDTLVAIGALLRGQHQRRVPRPTRHALDVG